MKPRLRRATRPLFLLSLLLMILIAAVLYSGARVLVWSALLLLSLLAGTVLWHAGIAIGLAVHVHVSAPDVIKGQTVHMQVAMHNRSPFPVLWLRLVSRTVESELGTPASRHIVTLAPFSRAVFSFVMPCPYRGSFQVGVASLDVLDPLRLYRRRIKRRRVPLQHLSVWPRRVGMPIAQHGQAALDEKPIPRRDHSEDLTSIYQIRSWRDGDPFKRIHWKLTARTGHWMVKEFDSTQRDVIAIVLDARAGTRLPLTQIRYEDALVEATFSICAHYLEAGHPIRLSTYADQRIHLHGSQAADVARFYEVLSTMPLNGFCSADEILTAEANLFAAGGRLIVIGPEPEERLLAHLILLAGARVEITLVIALADLQHASLSPRQKQQLAQAGVACYVAESDVGIQVLDHEVSR